MAVEFKDYYKVLGVPREATDEAIKQAFRRLARQHHPDVAKDKRGGEERFKEINEAYEVLGNPANRKKYDALGADWRAGSAFRPGSTWPPHAGRARSGTGAEEPFEFHFGGTGFSDFFEQVFGRAGRARGDAREPEGWEEFDDSAPAAHRGADVQSAILVTLEEVQRGAVRSVSVRSTNPRTGESETRGFKVRIPAGVREGQLIRIAGRGEAGVGGGTAGDLYLRVRLAAHPDFEVRGADLYHDLDLAPWEAVLGTTAAVPTLDGQVSVRIPPGTGSGQKLRLRGRGLPSGADGPVGDLFVVVAIQVPAELTKAERTLWEELARKSAFDPRPK